MKAQFKMKTIALAVAAFQMGTMNASAQPMLEEVVVTARKKPESLMAAPLSVTAVSGNHLDDAGITNLTQLSSQVPGLNLGVTAQTTSIYIRGIGSGINKGFEQSAGMYVDGVYQARSRLLRGDSRAAIIVASMPYSDSRGAAEETLGDFFAHLDAASAFSAKAVSTE